MMPLDSAYYEEPRGRVRRVLITVADQLPAQTVGLVDELIDANECGVALEMLSEMLVESNAGLDQRTIDDVRSLVERMGLDEEVTNRLQPLVGHAPSSGGKDV